MTRIFQVCRVVVLYNACFGCHCSPEAGARGFKSRYFPSFFRLFEYSLKRSFLTTKNTVFLTKKWKFLINGLFFSKLNPSPT